MRTAWFTQIMLECRILYAGDHRFEFDFALSAFCWTQIANSILKLNLFFPSGIRKENTRLPAGLHFHLTLSFSP
jgi:hypothetical protein